MANPKQLFEYRKQAVSTASPLQLVIMLYDGALRFMEAGKRAIEARDVDRQNTNLQKAQRILTELISCLDMRAGNEISQNLFGLYTYCYNTLVTANIEDRADLVDQPIRIMSDLRDSWVQIENQQRAGEEIASAA